MDDRVKELLDRVRSTAVTVGEVAGVTAREAGKRAGQMVDVAKLNMKIFDLKAETGNLMRQIGQLVYDAHRDPAADTSSMDDLLRQIDEKQEAVTEVRERITVLKNCRECPVCGTFCGKDDKFCKECGANL